MEFFFKPEGVAVIGASPNPDKGGNIIVANLQKSYAGKIYPVNPRYDEINGLKCYKSISELPDPVDLAIVYVGADKVPQTIRDCGRRGIRGAMLESAGFSESGPEGTALQAETAKIAEEFGIRLWGPNCMGLVDAVNRNVFSTVAPSIWNVGLTPGNVSLIVQSGMLAGAFLIDVMTHEVMGISKACSIGNKMDVDESDILEYLLDDPETGVIGLYLESIVDGPRFIKLCRQAQKPIVVLKGGKSAKGAEAALSHTASLAGNHAVVSGALRQAGVVEAYGFYQFMDLCRVLGMFPETSAEAGNRVAIMTYSGGAGIVSTDFLEEQGLVLAELSPASIDILRPVYPDWMPPANPMDLWPSIIGKGTVAVYNTAVRAACNDPGVDLIFAHCFVGGFALEPDLQTMAAVAREAGKPLVCWISGERELVHNFQIEARKLGVPAFREAYRAVECLGAIAGRNEAELSKSLTNEKAASPRAKIPAEMLKPKSDLSASLDEYRAKQVLAKIGVPVVREELVGSLSEALDAANSIGYPVVMKGIAPEMIHKTEAGLVRLGISSSEQLEAVFSDLQAAMSGGGQVLVQAQVSGAPELIVGLMRDQQFGPCVMCGLGGVLAEVLDDTVFALAPLSRTDALAMIARLKNQQLLNGFRGAQALDREALADILVKIGDLGISYPQITEIDINPLIVSQGRPLAVDAAIIF